MSTDSTKTSDTDTEEEPEENKDLGMTVEDEATETASEDDTDETASEEDTAETTSAPGSGFVAGAVALVGAALGLVSLTGTSLTDKLHARKEIIAQIDSRAGGDVDQMELFYSAPWNTVALVNGAFAVLAVLVCGGVLLALYGRRTETRSWVKALALGGLILGAIGLLIAVGMNFELFGDQPVLPTAPPPGG